MSNFVGIYPLNFQDFFSLKSHDFINIHEYYKMIICIFDHSVNMLCLSIDLKARSVLYGSRQYRYE